MIRTIFLILGFAFLLAYISVQATNVWYLVLVNSGLMSIAFLLYEINRPAKIIKRKLSKQHIENIRISAIKREAKKREARKAKSS